MKKSERTRRFIVSRIAPVFNTKGFAGTSFSDMTTATGLSKGAIYGNFRNKDELALASFDYNIGKIINGISSMMRQAHTPLEKLRVYPDFYKSAYYQDFMLTGCPIANLAAEADDTHEQLNRQINNVIAKWDDNIRHLVNKGIQSKQIKPEVNPAEVAAIIISQFEGGILLAKSTGNRQYFSYAITHVEHVLDNITMKA